MRILGLDPGIATVGYGTIDIPEREPVVGDFGIVQTSSKTEFSQRLLAIYEDMGSLLLTFKPDLIAIEKLFFYRMGNIIGVAQARGVILLCAAQKDIPYVEFSPPQIKQVLTGNGRADKKDMQLAVQRELNLDRLPKPDDAADALAIALTAWRMRVPALAHTAAIATTQAKS
jgi:crossover junction endodeoxyribonuclease RuvC